MGAKGFELVVLAHVLEAVQQRLDENPAHAPIG
jgi:hypothetical protein